MIVVDSTVLIDFLIGEERFQSSAKSLMDIDPYWVLPSLWSYELGNTLWKMISFKKLSPEIAALLIEQSQALVYESVESIDSLAVLKMAIDRSLTFYDASFVWLAKSRGLSLYTRDQEIIRKSPGIALSTIDL